MKTESNFITIHLDNQIILVDKNTESTYTGKVFNTLHKVISDGVSGNFYDYKIIAANPQIADLPLLPMLDDDKAEKLAEEMYPSMFIDYDLGTAISDRYAFVNGYKTAKQNSFTKEDMIGFSEWLRRNLYLQTTFGWYLHSNITKFYSEEELLKRYLDQKPKPQFIPEMEQRFLSGLNNDGEQDWVLLLKIIDGYIVGKWEQPSLQS